MYIISQPGLCDENEIFTEQIALLRNWAIDWQRSWLCGCSTLSGYRCKTNIVTLLSLKTTKARAKLAKLPAFPPVSRICL
jgi:hypothetical protein